MADDGEEKKILIFKPSYFIIKGSRILPDCAKWKNIYNQIWIVEDSQKSNNYEIIMILCK